MPYKQETINTPSLPFIYNVEQAVGTNSPNAKGDVTLVQYLLSGIYGPGSLKVDGWIGPITIGFIKRFQDEAKQGGNSVLADGRVDKAFAYKSKVSNTVYTIILLNMACRQRNPAAFSRLPANVPLNAAPRANPYNPSPAHAPGGNTAPPGGFNPGVGDPKYGGKYIVDQKTYRVMGMTTVITYWSDGTITSGTMSQPKQFMY